MKIVALLVLVVTLSQQPTFKKPVFELPPDRKVLLYHNNHYVETWKEEYRKMKFHSLRKSGNEWKLKAEEVMFVAVDDECLGAKVTYFRIKAADDPMIPLLVSPLYNENFHLESATWNNDKILKKQDSISINYRQQSFKLYVQLNSGGEYRLILGSGTSHVQVTQTNLDADYPVQLIFAGDLTADKQVDLIVQVMKENGIYWLLISPNLSSEGRLEIIQTDRCLFNAVPC